MSERAKESYLKALGKGKCKLRLLRLFLCGAGGVGKTSLCRSLTHEQFNAEQPSTIGADLEKAVCTVEKVTGSSSYIFRRVVSEDDYHQLLVGRSINEQVKEEEQAEDKLVVPRSIDERVRKEERVQGQQRRGEELAIGKS